MHYCKTVTVVGLCMFDHLMKVMGLLQSYRMFLNPLS